MKDPHVRQSASASIRLLAASGLVLLLASATARTQARLEGLDVRAANQQALKSEPLELVTFRFRVTNHGSDAEFAEFVDAAPDWRVVGHDSRFRLAQGKSDVRAVKLQVPASAPDGEYPISYTVSDILRPEQGRLATASVQISTPASVARNPPTAIAPLARVEPQPSVAASQPERPGPGRSEAALKATESPTQRPVAATSRIAQAAASTPPTNNGKAGLVAKAEPLLIEVKVNDLFLAGIIQAERTTDGRVVLPAETWAEARLRPPGEPVTMLGGRRGYALESVPGISYKLDRSSLTLAVTAPASAYDATKRSLGGRLAGPPTVSPPGAYLNYDLSAAHGSGTANRYGAIVEVVVFNGWGSLVSGTAIRRDDRTRDIVRTDTYWRKDFPGTMESLVVGDTIGSGGAWSRPTRFGGVRYARDFTLAPGYITYPMPSISGSAALPSTLDVLINNRRNASSNVQSGPFELTNVPVVTGAGDIQVVVRDMLGRETVINQSYYVAPQLLAKGLSDFSYEAGALRESYGTRSNDYGSVFAAGTYRLGLGDALTGEARAEAERDRVAAGFGISALVGQIGIVGLAAGYAVSEGERGGHYLASAQRTTPQGGFSVAVGHFERGYRPLGATGAEARPKDQIVAGAGIQIGMGMSAGVTYTRQTTWDGDRFALVGANLGIPLPGNAHLGAYVSKELDDKKGWSGGLNVIIPLDERRLVAANSTRDTRGELINTIQITQSVPVGPGLGWRLAASDSDAQRLQAGATLNTNYGQLSAEANAGRDTNALRAGINGSVGWLQGLAFASRRIDHGAFAVVQVGDLEGVGVSLSNQMAATTNARGLALVPGLLPYQLNQLTLDPDQLPFDVEIRGVRETAIPYARSGVFIGFPVKRSRGALVVLEQPGGAPVPSGATVTVVPGNQEFIVARRGEVYLMDLQDNNRIDVRWKGGECSLSLALGAASGSDEAPRIGPLSCGDSK